MSDGGVSMNVSIGDGITPALATLLRAAQNIDPVLEEIGASQLTEVQERFERQVGPDGKKWAPLAARTLAKRKAKSPIILSVTRNLYDSYTYKVKSKSNVTIGSNRRYARIQNLGGKAGRGLKVTIPARPQLGLSETGQKEIVDILNDHFQAK